MAEQPKQWTFTIFDLFVVSFLIIKGRLKYINSELWFDEVKLIILEINFIKYQTVQIESTIVVEFITIGNDLNALI